MIQMGEMGIPRCHCHHAAAGPQPVITTLLAFLLNPAAKRCDRISRHCKAHHRSCRAVYVDPPPPFREIPWMMRKNHDGTSLILCRHSYSLGSYRPWASMQQSKSFITRSSSFVVRETAWAPTLSSPYALSFELLDGDGYSSFQALENVIHAHRRSY